MWIPDSSSPSIEEKQERQTFSSTPTRVSTCPFLTTVGMSMSWLLWRVVRMRFWKKREKRPDEETKQGGVYLQEYWKVRGHIEERTVLPKD